MSFNISLFGCLVLMSVSAQELDPLTNGTIKETIYDVKLYVTIPASIIALGLFICLCYCLVCWTRDPDQGIRAFQPVIVSNRSTPLVVSSQNANHTAQGFQVKTGSHQPKPNEYPIPNPQKPVPNNKQKQPLMRRLWNRKDNTPESVAPDKRETECNKMPDRSSKTVPNTVKAAEVDKESVSSLDTVISGPIKDENQTNRLTAAKPKSDSMIGLNSKDSETFKHSNEVSK